MQFGSLHKQFERFSRLSQCHLKGWALSIPYLNIPAKHNSGCGRSKVSSECSQLSLCSFCSIQGRNRKDEVIPNEQGDPGLCKNKGEMVHSIGSPDSSLQTRGLNLPGRKCELIQVHSELLLSA